MPRPSMRPRSFKKTRRVKTSPPQKPEGRTSAYIEADVQVFLVFMEEIYDLWYKAAQFAIPALADAMLTPKETALYYAENRKQLEEAYLRRGLE